MSEQATPENQSSASAEADVPNAKEGITGLAAPASFGMTLAASLAVSIAVCLVAFYAYHHFLVPRSRIATVDIAEVLEIKQLQLTAQAAKLGATDSDRAAAYEEIGKFAKGMDDAVQELQKECDCVLLVRAAVVNGISADLTVALKKKMGLDNVNASQYMQSLTGKTAQPAGATRAGGASAAGMSSQGDKK